MLFFVDGALSQARSLSDSGDGPGDIVPLVSLQLEARDHAGGAGFDLQCGICGHLPVGTSPANPPPTVSDCEECWDQT